MPALAVYDNGSEEDHQALHTAVLEGMATGLDMLTDSVRNGTAAQGTIIKAASEAVSEEELERLRRIQKEDQEGGQK